MQMRRRDGYRIELLAGAVTDTLLSVIREHSHYAVNRSITQREIALWVSTDIHLFFLCVDLKYTFGDKFELTALAGLAEIVFFAVVSVMTLDLLVVLLKTRRDAEDSRQNCE